VDARKIADMLLYSAVGWVYNGISRKGLVNLVRDSLHLRHSNVRLGVTSVTLAVFKELHHFVQPRNELVCSLLPSCTFWTVSAYSTFNCIPQPSSELSIAEYSID
jgi:hypothetical protein